MDALAVQLVQQLRESVAADDDDDDEAMDEEGFDDEAAAARASMGGTASELEALVSELGQWRAYFELDDGLRAWSKRYERYNHHRGGGGTVSADMAGQQELAEGARQLLDGMTDRLLRSGWMGWLADPARALTEEEEGDVTGGSIGIELTLTYHPSSSEQLQRRWRAEWEGGEAAFPRLKVRAGLREGWDNAFRHAAFLYKAEGSASACSLVTPPPE